MLVGLARITADLLSVEAELSKRGIGLVILTRQSALLGMGR